MAASGPHLRQPTREDWDRLRPELERLRQVENKKIKDIVDFMRSIHGLRVTERMFRQRAKAWQIGKKRTEAEMKAVLRVLRQYENPPSQGAEVTLRGRRIGMHDISKFFKKKGVEDVSEMPTPSSSGAPDPPGLEIELPYAPEQVNEERKYARVDERINARVGQNDALYFCSNPSDIRFWTGRRTAYIEHPNDHHIYLRMELCSWELVRRLWLIQYAADGFDVVWSAFQCLTTAIHASANLDSFMNEAQHSVLKSRYNPYLLSPTLTNFFALIQGVTVTSTYRTSAGRYTDDLTKGVNSKDNVAMCMFSVYTMTMCERYIMAGLYDRANTNYVHICLRSPGYAEYLPLHVELEGSSACNIWSGIRQVLGKASEDFQEQHWHLIERLATLLQDSHANLRSLGFKVLSGPDKKTIFQTQALTLVTFPCGETTASQAETFFCLEIDRGPDFVSGMGFLCAVSVARNTLIEKAFFLAMPFATYKKRTTARHFSKT